MIRIGILSSHNGSGFEALQEACENKTIDAQVVLVISNNSDAQVLEKASNKDIPNFVINANRFPDENLDEKITNLMSEYKVDYIFLSGYMKKIETKLVKRFNNRIINSHPALLPNFGGKGMFGLNVHKAVKEAGVKETGCTIHFVNEHYDEGKVILQNKVEVKSEYSALDIEAKVKKLEAKSIVQAFEKLLA